VDMIWSDDQAMQTSTFLYNVSELHATCAVLHVCRQCLTSSILRGRNANAYNLPQLSKLVDAALHTANQCTDF